MKDLVEDLWGMGAPWCVSASEKNRAFAVLTLRAAEAIAHAMRSGALT